jgi:hypothetical protein
MRKWTLRWTQRSRTLDSTWQRANRRKICDQSREVRIIIFIKYIDFSTKILINIPREEEKKGLVEPSKDRLKFRTTAKELIPHCNYFLDMPADMPVLVVKSKVSENSESDNDENDFEYQTFKFKNPFTKRSISILKCTHQLCASKSNFFRKWHNFVDHQRTHTG